MTTTPRFTAGQVLARTEAFTVNRNWADSKDILNRVADERGAVSWVVYDHFYGQGVTGINDDGQPVMYVLGGRVYANGDYPEVLLNNARDGAGGAARLEPALAALCPRCNLHHADEDCW